IRRSFYHCYFHRFLAEGGIPILPDRFVADLLQHRGNLSGAALIRNIELPGGVGEPTIHRGSEIGSVVEFHNATALGAMDGITPSSGVAARFGMAPRAGMGDADREKAVAQPGRFARGKNQSHIWKNESKRTNQLD